jgi:hypothetical protein
VSAQSKAEARRRKAEWARNEYARHPERYRRRVSKYRAANKRKIKAREKAHRAKERTRKRLRAYYANYRAATREKNKARRLLSSARSRAKKSGLAFGLNLADIVIPEKCPVLGGPLKLGAGRVGPWSPSLDKIIPALGYVRENVAIISHRANTIKSDASYQELFQIAEYTRECVSPRRWPPSGFRSVHYRPEGWPSPRQ